MKQKTVRVPDEGELWTSGSHGGWYVVIKGKFVRVGLTEVQEAGNTQRLKLALDDFFNPRAYREYSKPRIDENTYDGNRFTLRADDYKAHLREIVNAKLRSWADQHREANEAFLAVMAK